MKKILIGIIVFMISYTIKAQDYKFGKVSKAELEEKFYPLDSSANAVILYKKRSTYYDYVQNTGIKLITNYIFRIKIYNEEGYDWATKEISLSQRQSSKETVSDLKASTYNLENGKIVVTKLDKKNIFKEEKNKFRRVQKFTFPNIKNGCIVEMKYQVTSPFYSSVDDMVLQYSIPIKKYEGKVSLLGFFNFNKRSKGYFNFSVNELSKTNLKFDTNDRLISVSHENIPALIQESYVNNINNYRARVVFEVASINIPGRVYENFSASWDDVAKTIYESEKFGGELKKKSVLKDEEIEKLKSLNKKEKIIGALEYVKNKIKWNDFYGKTVHDGVKHAIKEGVGNSGEINLFLVMVLREIGLNANPVLQSTRENGIPFLPTSDKLNYVTAVVESEDNSILLDATELYTSPNVLPTRALNWQGRIVRKDGTSSWINVTPSEPAVLNSNVTINILEDAKVSGISRKQYTNYYALNYRNNYNELNEDDLISKIESANGNIEIENIRVSNKKDIYKPIVEFFQFNSEDLINEINNKLYIKSIMLNAITENPFKLKKREYPIDFTVPFLDKKNYSITIPEGYEVESAPENLAIGLSNEYGTYIFKIIISGRIINIISQLNITTAIIPVENYEEIKEFYKQIVNKQKEQIVLKKI